MDKYLFRGKRTDNNKWIEGGYCYCNNKSYIAITTRYIPDTRDWDEADYYEKHPVYKPMFIEVLPETVGQYTGLKDTNGKKIFEGDIVRCREWSNGDMCWVGKVHYEHQQFVVSGGKNKECETPFTLVMSRFIPKNIEVIGNTYDNSELLNN